jgi:hypothetical protein
MGSVAGAETVVIGVVAGVLMVEKRAFLRKEVELTDLSKLAPS